MKGQKWKCNSNFWLETKSPKKEEKKKLENWKNEQFLLLPSLIVRREKWHRRRNLSRRRIKPTTNLLLLLPYRILATRNRLKSQSFWFLPRTRIACDGSSSTFAGPLLLLRLSLQSTTRSPSLMRRRNSLISTGNSLAKSFQMIRSNPLSPLSE